MKPERNNARRPIFPGIETLRTMKFLATIQQKVRALTPLPPLPWQPDQPESGPEQARLL